MFLIALLCMFISSALAGEERITYPSKCPKVEGIKNFDIEAYAKGIWYEAQRYPNELETSYKCVKLNFTLEQNTINIKSVGVPEKCSSYIKITSKLSPDAKGSGNLTTKWNTGAVNKTVTLIRYILDTDYKSYAILYSCVYNEKAKNHQVYVWIHLRDKVYEGKAKESVEKYIESNDAINSDDLMVIDNSDKACKAAKCCEKKESD